MNKSLVSLLLAVTICWCTSAAVLASGTPPQASSATLEAWVVDLDSDKYAVREAATNALQEVGPQAVPYLRHAVLGDSLEAADRAVWVLKQFAKSKELKLQQSALEVLADAERFPGVVRDAKQQLAELYEEICRERLVELGASFSSEVGGVNAIRLDGVMISVNTNRSEWTGTPDDLLMLSKLSNIAMLRLASRDLADEQVRKLAAIDGLEILELIETKTTVACIEEIKKSNPQLRVRLKNKAMLGVGLSDMGAPTVTTVYDGKPAQKAGMKTGDVVLKFAGHQINTFDDLTTRISQHAPGDKVDVIVNRGGEEKKLEVTLGGTDWSQDDPMNGATPKITTPNGAPRVQIQIIPARNIPAQK